MASRAWRPGEMRWEVAAPFDGAADLARRLGTAPIVGQILYNRGIRTHEQGLSFLNPKLTDLHDPLLLSGAEEAGRRIAAAVAQKRKIVIYGDYDVDGMTAVAIIHACLRMMGADVSFYVPHRLEEGYGVNAEALRKIAAEGTGLLVTVDCGISAAEPLEEAMRAGMEVIVTDHHALPDRLPNVAAVVHPRLGGYPNPDLCGAGVAFKLAWQVARQVGGETRVDAQMREFLLDATTLAALGTIADVMPLVGENRTLAVFGLRGLAATKHHGLRALLDSADLTGERLDAYHVGFVLGPRLNACGRMGHARLAVELLTDAPEERCREIARFLAEQNVERQKVERAITEQASQMVVDRGLDKADSRAIVLACDQWHGGVIGIVAARLVDRFSRPVVLVAFNGDGGGHGSARSIPGFHMAEALAACGEHLLGFGGHEMAGGLRIVRDKLSAFEEAMAEYARRNVRQQQLVPAVAIDAETTLPALGFSTVEHMGRLAPFGQGNPPPMVAVRGCKVMMPPKRMGRSGQAVSFYVGQGGSSIRAVGFGMGDLADMLIGVNEVDIAAEPGLNEFNGTKNIELRLRDVKWKK